MRLCIQPKLFTYQKYRDNSSKQQLDEHYEEAGYWDLKLLSTLVSQRRNDTDHHRHMSVPTQVNELQV